MSSFLPLAAKFPPAGPVHSLAGAAIHAAYYGTGAPANGSLSDAFGAGSNRRRVRFMARVTKAPAGSTIATFTVKLKQRYDDGTNTGAPADLASSLDDAAGTAQPKGPTFEVEHAFTAPGAGLTLDYYFWLDVPDAIDALFIDVKADVAGVAGDSVVVFARAPRVS